MVVKVFVASVTSLDATNRPVSARKFEKGNVARLSSPSVKAPQAINGMAKRLVNNPAGLN